MIWVLAACGSQQGRTEPPPEAPTSAPTPTSAVDAASSAAPPAPADRPVEPGPDLRGICDASAAVAVGRFLVVADDERNVLRVYDWSAGAAPVAPIDLGRLAPALRGDEEADLEGMAALPDGTVWFTGSHDAGKGDTRKPSRQRVFALKLTEGAAGVEAALAAGPTADFIEKGQWTNQLLGIVENTEGKPAKHALGLSIEGLAAGPAGSLLFGFRAPVHGGKALIERLDDPVGLAGGGEPKLTGPRWIDLGGRGVRSLEADADGFLIVAGPPGDSKGDARGWKGEAFGLYRWTGFDDQAVQPVRLPVAFGDLNPEGLVRIGDRWWVLSDDGRRELDGSGKDCRDLPEAERRARTAALPPLGS